MIYSIHVLSKFAILDHLTLCVRACDCSANFSSQKLQVESVFTGRRQSLESTGTKECPKGFRILLFLLSSSCNNSHFLACFYEYMFYCHVMFPAENGHLLKQRDEILSFPTAYKHTHTYIYIEESKIWLICS